MKRTSLSICAGLGDNIIARMIFDTVKHEYDQIKISHDKDVIRIWKENKPDHLIFLKDLGNLLFSEPPYHFDELRYNQIQTFATIKMCSPIAKPNLQHLLCKGNPLDIDCEYICITSKIRLIEKKKFLPMSIQLWSALKQLSNRYKIVIIGERKIEEFSFYKQALPDNITYSIYDQIVANLPVERIIDLTIPSLGVIAPKLHEVQQDGSILKGAKFAICLGNGGNLWHAVATANKVIGYRDVNDRDDIGDALVYPNFTHVSMHKNWDQFIEELRGS